MDAPFIIGIDLPARDCAIEWEIRAMADDWFVPSEVEKGSTDERHLSFRVESSEISD